MEAALEELSKKLGRLKGVDKLYKEARKAGIDVTKKQKWNPNQPPKQHIFIKFVEKCGPETWVRFCIILYRFGTILT